MTVLNGLFIEHVWFTDKQQNTPYHGHIISVKQAGQVPKATVSYWAQEEGKDEKVSILQLLSDYITSDVFC